MSEATSDAYAQYMQSNSRPRKIPVRERVNLSDTETVQAAEIAAGDVFVYEGKIYVALSAYLSSLSVYVHTWEDRTDVHKLVMAEDENVLVFS